MAHRRRRVGRSDVFSSGKPDMIDLTPDAARARRAPALAVFTVVLAAAAFLTPLWAAEPDRAAGLLLIAGVGAELLQSFRRRAAAAQHSAWASAGYTLLAIVLIQWWITEVPPLRDTGSR